MLRALCYGSLILSILITASAYEAGYSRCNCDLEGFWSTERILQCQKVGDFLIAAAYFSIPLELFYFLTCSQVFPFKWVLFQFGAFIVLCGLTHFLNVFTYGQHSFLLMLALSVSKFLTALVSFATSITLLTLIPQLLRVKVRENLLRIKARELDREVVMMKRQEETRWHVRMLTREIRKSLDRHTILYTTLVELSETLELKNCAVWMPDEEKKEMHLTHELRQRGPSDVFCSIPIDDPDVVEIVGTNDARVLKPDSLLGTGSSRAGDIPGAVAAIRMPMLKVSNFKGGTPQLVQTCYAILVLVLPEDGSRVWTANELEIIEVIADQVAVALSHAAVLEESQSMRDKLAEQNRDLLQAKQKAVMASEARTSFQRAMGHAMGRPIHSILGLLSMMQRENLGPEQKLAIDTMVKTSTVVSSLINDVTEVSTINSQRLLLEMKSFHLHSMIKEAASAARCLCDSRGFGFEIQVGERVPDRVVGDERRIFLVILHMIGNLLNAFNEGFMMFRILNSSTDDQEDQMWRSWGSNTSGSFSCVKFEIEVRRLQSDDSGLTPQFARKPDSGGIETSLSFSMCRKLVQMMQGNISAVPNSHGYTECMTLVLRFQPQPSDSITELEGSFERQQHPSSTPRFKGLKVLLADDDDTNRAVTRKLLEKLGCRVSSVSSGIQCLNCLATFGTPFPLVVLDLQMSKMDGFEVAAKISELRTTSWPIIIALTTSAKEEVWERCLRSGINGLIRKPVIVQAMAEELRRVLQNR
ncbi:putative non-specific serine/threonine protein kinase [Dioscorea sansibarensis]